MRLAARALRAVRLVALAVLGMACRGEGRSRQQRPEAADATTHAVQRLALDTLFNGRERAARLVLWATDAGNGPALESLGLAVAPSREPRAIDLPRLAPSLPARVMTEAQVAALFREHPDGWAAFFRDNPGAAGLVELSPVRLVDDGRGAETYVGRSCGEHCRNVWRLTARRVSSSGWRVDSLQWVRVRGS